MKSKLPLCFMNHPFGIMSKNFLPTKRSWRLFLIFSQKVLKFHIYICDQPWVHLWIMCEVHMQGYFLHKILSYSVTSIENNILSSVTAVERFHKSTVHTVQIHPGHASMCPLTVWSDWLHCCAGWFYVSSA